MGRKRKTPQSTGPAGPREVDVADARLGPINSFEDVADDQDEYFMNQDKITVDDRSSKRQKMREEAEAFLEDSDEEVFDYGNDDDEDDDDEEEENKAPKKSKKSAKKGAKGSDNEDEDKGEEEEEGDERWWGSSKKEYYNADAIETEADALEEEAEAKRIQHKKLSKMADEDFMFDENEWKTTEDKTSGEDVVTEVLADAEIPDDLTPEDSLRLLSTRYPEFEYLATEFEELKPVLESRRQAAEGKDNKSLEMVQYIVLASYLAALASYFAILTSPARDSTDTYKTIDPAELREHEVMTALLKCRDMWTHVRDIKSTKALDTESTPVNSDVEGGSEYNSEDDEFYTPGKTPDSVKTTKAKSGIKISKDVEDDLADLYNMPLKLGKKQKKQKAAAEQEDEEEANEGDSDFGEEEELDEKAALEKAQRKKSLRFYTSQIVQKSSRRAGAGRDAGGDMDIPYRERLKDRQARLNAEAEKRGRKDSKFGADLDGADSDAEDQAARQAVNKSNEDDEYYDMVAAKGRKKRADKDERFAAYAAAGKADRVVEVADVGEDGKRKITYTIEKNKGLAPKRKKENRNPRVKKRLKYEEKMKKLKSMKPTFAGPGQGGYQGIKTGIKAGLIKSTKFQS